MSVDSRELASLLRPVVRRLILREAATRACRQAGMVATAAVGWDLLSGHALGPGALGVLGAFLVLAALAGLVRIRVPLLAAARAADARLGLADQLGTAVDLLGRSRDRVAGLAALQVGQALEVARTVDLRRAAPVGVPREWGPALAVWAILALWTGVAPAPGAPGVRHEGHLLRLAAERLAERSRAGHLPETRRAAGDLLSAARRLEKGGTSREQALGLLRDLGQRLRTAQGILEQRVAGVLGRGRAEPRDGLGAPSTAWVDGAIRTLQAADDLLAGRPREGGPSRLDGQLRDLAALLARSGAPPEVRRLVDRARRDLAAGSPRSAETAVGEALQDLRAVERMLGDVQGLKEARRAVGESVERLAAVGEGRTPHELEGRPRPPAGPPSLSPGPVAPTPAQGGSPPPPGPHEGSRPGEGRGGILGAPTPRLGGTRLPVQLNGPSGGGTSSLREVVAPGRTSAPSRPTARLPSDVAHQLDLSMERDILPPSYLRVVRRYFAGEGRGP